MHRVGASVKEEFSSVNYKIDGNSNLEKDKLGTSVFD